MFVSLSMKTQCPKCRSSLEVQHADGSASDCPACGHSFVPAALPEPIPGATHICVRCHTQGEGEWIKPKGPQNGLLFFLGLVTLLFGSMIFGTIGGLVGVTIMVVAVVMSVLPRDTEPALRCPSCSSVEMIPIDSPRAESIRSTGVFPAQTS